MNFVELCVQAAFYVTFCNNYRPTTWSLHGISAVREIKARRPPCSKERLKPSGKIYCRKNIARKSHFTVNQASMCHGRADLRPYARGAEMWRVSNNFFKERN